MQPGEKFPSFVGVSHDGEQVDIAKYSSDKNLVVFFYPKATTAGCVKETTEFSARIEEFERLNASILGVSVDPQEEQKKHAIQCAASFPLLTDAGGELAKQLDIVSERGTAKRTMYVLDAQRKVVRVFEGVSVDGHVDEVLESLSSKQER